MFTPAIMSMRLTQNDRYAGFPSEMNVRRYALRPLTRSRGVTGRRVWDLSVMLQSIGSYAESNTKIELMRFLMLDLRDDEWRIINGIV